jgi:GrpB-like predicted nucleotidyltransferase (UPF0157 family)
VRPDPAEPIVVVAYDPRWPQLFEQERRRVADALGDAVVEQEHIGSTAVPGLAAKPIVDILAGLRTLELPADAIEAMEKLGYEFLGEYGIAGRLFFRKGRPRSHHVHAVLLGSDLWERHLAFRDYLRVHSAEADAYAQFKLKLVRDVGGDRDRYVDGKDAFAAILERRARSWRRRSSFQTGNSVC